MKALYLYVNAALYLLFAIWCTFGMARTAPAMGFTVLASGGRSEYLAIYGGLQLGLAVGFGLLARNASWHEEGILFALVLYAPIVAFRMFSLIRFWPVGGVTLATAALELAMLVTAAWLYAAR